MKHTHRANQIRTDYELAALHAMLCFHGPNPETKTIDDLEYRWRGTEHFEAAVRDLAKWLEEFHPGFVAEQYEGG